MATFGKVNRSAAFNPTSAFPLDARYYFDSLTAAQKAAAGAVEVGSSDGTYFYGENIVVVENDKATLYLIQPDKSLTEVGSVPVGDGKSITVENGQIKIVGFEEAEAGSQPRKASDGSIEWVKPDTTTVEGLQTLVTGLESDVNTLQTAVDTLNGTGEGSVDKKVADAVAAIVADAPEAYDTLKEISDWISSHASSAAEMNSQINTNKSDIEALEALIGKLPQGAESVTVIDYIHEVVNAMGDTKVDKVEGSRLMLETEGTKLAGIEEGAQVNAIETVDETQFAIDENKNLTLLDIAMSKVTGLTSALDGKVDKVEGSRLITDEEGEKLAAIEEGAQVNVIEQVKVNGVALDIVDKAVDIPVSSADNLGVVKSSTGENKVSVDTDGVMSVESVNVKTLVQTDGDVLILNGGSSSI